MDSMTFQVPSSPDDSVINCRSHHLLCLPSLKIFPLIRTGRSNLALDISGPIYANLCETPKGSDLSLETEEVLIFSALYTDPRTATLVS